MALLKGQHEHTNVGSQHPICTLCILLAESAGVTAPSKRPRVHAHGKNDGQNAHRGGAESSDVEADVVPSVLRWRELACNVAEATVELEGCLFRGLMAEIDPGTAKQVGTGWVGCRACSVGDT